MLGHSPPVRTSPLRGRRSIGEVDLRLKRFMRESAIRSLAVRRWQRLEHCGESFEVVVEHVEDDVVPDVEVLVNDDVATIEGQPISVYRSVISTGSARTAPPMTAKLRSTASDAISLRRRSLEDRCCR
ncbi:hypothetical protein [Georgenia yuyongxinii]